MEVFTLLSVKNAVSAARKLVAEADAYEARPTKACSKRMREHLNNIKKLATPAKQELIQADKA